MKDAAAHWDSVFETKGSDEVQLVPGRARYVPSSVGALGVA